MTRGKPELPIFLIMVVLSHLIMAQVQPKRIAFYPIEKPAPVLDVPVTAAKRQDFAILPTRSTPSIVMPLAEYRITSGFGWRKHPVTCKRDFHNGIDLAFQSGIVRN